MQLELRSHRACAAAAALAMTWPLGCGPSPVIMAPPPEPPPTEEQQTAPAEGQRSPAQVATDPEGAGALPVAHNTCDLAPRVAALAPGCERLRGVAALGTGAERAAVAAFDGDACSIWSSGGHAPQSATLDLGAPMHVSMVLLVPEMTPSPATVHHILEVSDDGKSFVRLGQLRTTMRTGEVVELPIPGGVETRFLRVTTSESPSWVAWRDVVVLRCGAARRR
jgi:hypothetical protein